MGSQAEDSDLRKFIKNTKGAVTVFVTLLLIPAMLVSGTAVDLARIHTAQSIIHDANQLAANTVLTQYNALLQDLYGLYGVAEDDPILAALLDEYIRVAVFGEAGQDRSLGTLQLFYGSNISMEELVFAEGKNLRDVDVLRRQIEEYMKFRGPVLIVKEILDALGSSKLSEDAAVINNKLEIESAIAALFDKYKELYNAIVAADLVLHPTDGISGGSFGAMSRRLTSIRDEFVNLKSAHSAWRNATDEVNKADYEAWYKAVLVNIRSYMLGGQRGSNWKGKSWQTTGNIYTSMSQIIENAKTQADNFKPKFDLVVKIAQEIDEMIQPLKEKIDELEQRLISGDMSEELRNALTEKHGDPPKSYIDRCKEMVKWSDITAMATVFRDGGYRYIDDIHKPMLDGVMYRNVASPTAGSLTLEQLESLSTNPGFDINASTNRASLFADFPKDNVTYKMAPGFLKFREHPGRNQAFYKELEAMMNQPKLPPIKLYEDQENPDDSENSNSEENQRAMIDDLLELVETAYIGLSNSPLGAMYIKDSATPAPNKLGILDILTLIPKAIAEPVISVLSDPVGKALDSADYMLLLAYSTSAFSNYTTTRPESIGKTRDNLDEINFTKSITGVPMSPEVNYFFQSEWEYLYHGEDNASKNLSAVTRLIFLVRLVCNYITVFGVSEVTTVVNSIQAAFSWFPPLGLLLGELARAAFVAAESVVDVATLRTGHRLPLIKDAGQWVCSPSGIRKALSEITSNESANKKDTGDTSEEKKGLSYSNYMIFFMLTKAVFYFGAEADAATELAIRTGNLIEWNMINYQNSVNSDEGKMAEALGKSDRFMLINMKTDFSLTTTVDLRMLFFSMLFAQDFSDSRGIGIQSTMPLRVTDYRGY